MKKSPALFGVPRLFGWAAIAGVLLVMVTLLFPQQISVALFKVALVSIAGVVGYYLDRSLFPYARPDGYLRHHPDGRYHREASSTDADYQVVEAYHLVFCLAMLRRSIIVGCAMLAVGLGA